MPQIEELHTTAKAAAPGWSYEIDTGYDPSKVAINPTSSKRQKKGPNNISSASELSLRQQTAIQRHIAELDRENHKSEHIVVPKSKLDKKQTTNVKRVLASGKTFAHYIQDEEALAAQQGGGSSTTNAIIAQADATKAKPAQRPSKTPIARRKSALLAREDSNSESSPAPSNAAAAAASAAQSRVPLNSFTAPAPPSSTTTSQKPIKPWDVSILTPTTPLSISEAEIEALLSAPPLTYNAAKSAAPPASAPRQRVFCEICGYWGRVRCTKCGARVCGLECKGVHDEGRCLRF